MALAARPGPGYLRPQRTRSLRPLALLPDVGRQRDGHLADDRRVRGGDPVAVPASGARAMSPDRESRMWTERVRERAVRALPPEKLLPDRQPAYVSSWIYVFGVATIAALIVVVISGVILGLKGP